MKYVKRTHVKLVQFYEKKWEEAGLSLIHIFVIIFINIYTQKLTDLTEQEAEQGDEDEIRTSCKIGNFLHFEDTCQSKV